MLTPHPSVPDTLVALSGLALDLALAISAPSSLPEYGSTQETPCICVWWRVDNTGYITVSCTCYSILILVYQVLWGALRDAENAGKPRYRVRLRESQFSRDPVCFQKHPELKHGCLYFSRDLSELLPFLVAEEIPHCYNFLLCGVLFPGRTRYRLILQPWARPCPEQAPE